MHPREIGEGPVEIDDHGLDLFDDGRYSGCRLRGWFLRCQLIHQFFRGEDRFFERG